MKQLSKPALFPDTKGFLYFVLTLFIFIMLRLFFEYQNYKTFIEKPFYYTYAQVIHSYEKTKNAKTYKVLKLRSDEGFSFYTTSHRKEDFNHKRLRLQIFPNDSISFLDYLGIFYVKSKIKQQEKIPLTFKDTLLQKVASQHENKDLASFYAAIFFATPLEPTLREKVALLGVSHLVALSGFHLGILWTLVYGILFLIYRPFQQSYFPYRHALFDVGILAMTILGIYVWFVDFPPSLLRSYAMVFVGWAVLLLGLELLSFRFLLAIFLLLGLIFPSLLVSLGFWLSVAGVFYIFLLLQYSKSWNKWLISLVLIPVGIFILMLAIVHSVFGITSAYQLLSPLLSLLFIPFYPLAMLAHLLGWGGIFDVVLLDLFTLVNEGEEHILSLGLLLIYLALSLGAIWSKRVFYILLASAVLYMLYLFIPIE